MRTNTKLTAEKIINVIVFLLLTLILLSFTACDETSLIPQKDGKIKVTIATHENFSSSQNFLKIERGEDVTVTLTFSDGYAFDGCDYEDYVATGKTENTTDLTLKNVLYSSFVTIKVRVVDSGIFYRLNGGSLISGENADGFFEWETALEGRRQNTNIGEDIKREGYTLTSWNTKADGSGDRIGLGSRVTLPENEIIDLYAQWEKWIDGENFACEKVDDGIVLTEYLGDKTVEPFTIPEAIDGNKVVGIGEGFLTGGKSQTLILPKGLKRVEKGAFKQCAFKTLCFFDDLEYIIDGSFSNTKFSTLYINASIAPRYIGRTEVSEFTDRMDRLILNKDKKKIIFFAGCSMCYGLDSQTVYDAFDGEYEIINFGTMGETHAGAQMDCIAKFLKKGDVFLHAPEEAAPYQLMYYHTLEPNIYILCEGNFDLISYMDFTDITGVFNAFNRFNGQRLKADGGSYNDDTELHNEYGDVITERPYTGENKSYSDDYGYVIEYATEASITRLCDAYDKLVKTSGAKVYFSFGPVNYHGLTEEAKRFSEWKFFEDIYVNGLSKRGYRVISKAEDYLYEGRYFYDTDYHLNCEGVKIRTERLIADIKNALQ